MSVLLCSMPEISQGMHSAVLWFLKQHQGKGMHVLDYVRRKPEVVSHSQNSPQERKSRKHCKDTYRKGDLHETEEPPGRIGSDP